MTRLLNPETEEEYGPEFRDAEELANFMTWHVDGDQRTLIQTDEDGDLEAQVEWWRNGGHLNNPES